MNFLNPAFLWVLPAAGLPFLLHLLNKKPPKKIVFSHIRWLKDVHESLMPKRRLREVLLLIVRTLLVLFLIFFFARPVFQGGGVLSGRGGNASLLLLVDVSASMGAIEGGRQALENVQGRLKEVVRKLPSDARVGLVAYSDRVEAELAPTEERAKLMAKIDELKVTHRPTQILSALPVAYGMLAHQTSRRKSLLIVSDAAAHGFKESLAAPGRWENFDPEVSIILWEAVELLPNMGIVDASLQLSEEGSLKGAASVLQSGQNKAPRHWGLTLNRRQVAEGAIKSTDELRVEIPLDAKLPEGGYYAGVVELTPDGLPFDDRFYLAGRVPLGFKVLIVDGEAGLAPADAESYYLKLALESPRDPRLESLKVTTPDRFALESLESFDVVVLANTGDLGSMKEALLLWVQKGGGLFVAAGPKWGKPPVAPVDLFRIKSGAEKTGTLKPPEPSATFLKAITGLSDFEWNEIKIQNMVPIEVDAGTEALLSTEAGEAFLALRSVGKGHVLVLTSTLNRAWNNMAAKPVFAPLMREVIATLADPLREETSLLATIDAPVSLRLPPGLRSVSVVGPDGSVAGARVTEDGMLHWPGAAVPGLYQVKTDQPLKDFSFALNLRGSSSESELTRVTEADIREVFPKARVDIVKRGAQSQVQVVSALQGREAGTLLLWLIFILFAAETVLGWRRQMPAAMFLLLIAWPAAQAEEGNEFVYTQIQHAGAWDPYPEVHSKVFEMITTMTNIPLAEERRVITLSDPALFQSTFILIKGNSALNFSAPEKQRLKQYIDRGGFVLIDDTLADPQGSFGLSTRKLFAELYPDKIFQKIPPEHALFRSFFLMRNVAGRRMAQKYLEGLEVGGQLGGEGRTAVIYSPNDLMGAWMKDNLGQYAYSCEPGGEPQRWESFKLTLNIIYFSLTGTYKRDAIHQPFIEKKLGL